MKKKEKKWEKTEGRGKDGRKKIGEKITNEIKEKEEEERERKTVGKILKDNASGEEDKLKNKREAKLKKKGRQ